MTENKLHNKVWSQRLLTPKLLDNSKAGSYAQESIDFSFFFVCSCSVLSGQYIVHNKYTTAQNNRRLNSTEQYMLVL